MIPMTMRKKEIIEQDLPLLDKCLYFSAKAARVNKNPDSGLMVCHQITVDSEAPNGKTPEYQIGHHDTKQFYNSYLLRKHYIVTLNHVMNTFQYIVSGSLILNLSPVAPLEATTRSDSRDSGFIYIDSEIGDPEKCHAGFISASLSGSGSAPTASPVRRSP
ncbi:MAG: hypothetical protein ACE5GU_13985 [Candidatus Scalinduaceae bacterium]